MKKRRPAEFCDGPTMVHVVENSTGHLSKQPGEWPERTFFRWLKNSVSLKELKERKATMNRHTPEMTNSN